MRRAHADAMTILRSELPSDADFRELVELVLLDPAKQGCLLLAKYLLLAYSRDADDLRLCARMLLVNHPWRPGTLESRLQLMQDNVGGAARF